MSHPSLDIDQLARQSIQPVETFLAPSAVIKQPIKKFQRSQWKPQYQLTDFTVPVHVQSPSIKRKFKILVQCFDSKSQKYFSKTVFFGEDNDYVFTHDKSQRLKKILSLKNKDNPLHADYWRAHLCLSSPDFKQNCKKMLNFLLQKRFAQSPKYNSQAISKKKTE